MAATVHQAVVLAFVIDFFLVLIFNRIDIGTQANDGRFFVGRRTAHVHRKTGCKIRRYKRNAMLLQEFPQTQRRLMFVKTNFRMPMQFAAQFDLISENFVTNRGNDS